MLLVSLISYVDRSTLALLAPTILTETHLTGEQYGFIISAFSIAYMLSNPIWGCSQTLGDLIIEIPESTGEIRDYCRRLDLDTALATVSYSLDGIAYTREVLASYPEQCIAIRLTASKPRSWSCLR